MKKIVKLNLFPKRRNFSTSDGRKLEPVIYIHFYKKKAQYVGETIDINTGRPFRAADGTYGRRYPVEDVVCIPATSNAKRRLYWEAFLVCKLKPKQQNLKTYKRRVEIYHEDKLREQRRKRYCKPTKDFIKELKHEKK